MFDSIFRRKNDEEKMRAAGRLPPGQSLTQRFPVLHYGPVPPLTRHLGFPRLGRGRTTPAPVVGRVQPAAARAGPHGPALRDALEQVRHALGRRCRAHAGRAGAAEDQAVGALTSCSTPSTVSPSTCRCEVVLQDNFLLATHYDGEPIDAEHGYPLRGVMGAIPERDDLITPYLWKGAKWLRGLEFLTEDQPGFWEEAGYHNKADVWKEERYAR